jgi:hypothetical protein
MRLNLLLTATASLMTLSTLSGWAMDYDRIREPLSPSGGGNEAPGEWPRPGAPNYYASQNLIIPGSGDVVRAGTSSQRRGSLSPAGSYRNSVC